MLTHHPQLMKTDKQQAVQLQPLVTSFTHTLFTTHVHYLMSMNTLRTWLRISSPLYLCRTRRTPTNGEWDFDPHTVLFGILIVIQSLLFNSIEVKLSDTCCHCIPLFPRTPLRFSLEHNQSPWKRTSKRNAKNKYCRSISYLPPLLASHFSATFLAPAI